MPVVNPTQPPAQTTGGLSPLAFLAQAFIWMGQNWLYLGVGLLIAFGVYAFYRIYIKQKEEDDIFLRDYKRTKEMCVLQRNHRRIRGSPIPLYIFGIFLFIGIGMLIIGVAMNWGNFLIWSFGVFGIGLFISGFIHWTGLFTRRDRVYISSGDNSKFLGFYGGESVTENMKNFLIQKGLGPFKKEFIVRVNLNKIIPLQIPESSNPSEDKKTKKIKPEDMPKIALPDYPAIEGEDSIIIKGIGLQQYRYFLYPVLFNQYGNPISMKFVAMAIEKDVALTDTLYDQTQDFARIMREQVNINPNVRYQQKTRGESSAVE